MKRSRASRACASISEFMDPATAASHRAAGSTGARADAERLRPDLDLSRPPTTQALRHAEELRDAGLKVSREPRHAAARALPQIARRDRIDEVFAGSRRRGAWDSIHQGERGADAGFTRTRRCARRWGRDQARVRSSSDAVDFQHTGRARSWCRRGDPGEPRCRFRSSPPGGRPSAPPRSIVTATEGTVGVIASVTRPFCGHATASASPPTARSALPLSLKE